MTRRNPHSRIGYTPLDTAEERALIRHAIDNATPEQLLRLIMASMDGLGMSLRVPRKSAKQRAAEAAAAAAAKRAAEAAAAQADADYELRKEVIDTLAAKGVARHVAAVRTNTEAKLLSEAKALGLI